MAVAIVQPHRTIPCCGGGIFITTPAAGDVPWAFSLCCDLCGGKLVGVTKAAIIIEAGQHARIEIGRDRYRATFRERGA